MTCGKIDNLLCSIYDAQTIQIPCQFLQMRTIRALEYVHREIEGSCSLGETLAHKYHLLALNSGENLARDSICKLAECLGGWLGSDQPLAVLANRYGIPVADMVEARRLTDEASQLAARQLEQAKDSDTQILTIVDSGYPALLRHLELPPPVLYCRGQIPRSPAVAIVGSRRATQQGLEVAELFGRELAACGLTVVSGFARGIDLAAHRGALSTNDGRTVAVLGCGLDIDYPRGRHRVRRALAARGALLSEFPFGAQPRSWNFPIRNRIIAALTLGTLVVEGTPKSGSLITARLALDLGRDVYAIPGSILDPRSAGPNTLIQDGALLIRHPVEIVESLPISVRDILDSPALGNSDPGLPGLPGKLLEALPPGQTFTAEHLAVALGEPLDQILGLLLELEMTGYVKRLPGAVFGRPLRI